jgi:predicted RNA-binding Zn-ribbon protein involved in translation (DUF1610 family)
MRSGFLPGDIETLIGTIAREAAAPFLDFHCPACGKAKIVRVIAPRSYLCMCDECGAQWSSMQAVLDHAFRCGVAFSNGSAQVVAAIIAAAPSIARAILDAPIDDGRRRDAPTTEVPDSRRSDPDARDSANPAPRDQDQ